MEDPTLQPPLLRINDDVLHEICDLFITPQSDRWGRRTRDPKSLTALSSCCKALRQALAPLVFRKIDLSVKDDLKWEKATSAMKAIARCEAASQHTRQCAIEISSGKKKPAPAVPVLRKTKMERIVSKLKGGKTKTPSEPPVLRPPPGLPSTLAEFFGGTRNLNKIGIALPHVQTEPFRQAFEKSSVSLPLVKTLALGPCMQWLIPMCPNVTTISTQDCPQWYEAVDENGEKKYILKLIEAAGKAAQLERFEMKRPCDYAIVRAVLQAMPDILELHLANHSGIWDLQSPMRAGAELLDTLGKFSRLRSLEIPGIGETPQWPWCGNAFDGPGGAEYYQQLRTQTDEANKRAVDAIVPVCKKLDGIRVAHDSAWIIDRSAEDEVVALRKDDREASERDF